MKNKKIIPAVMLLLVTAVSCQSDYTPKPRGYFRIDMPKRSYQTFDTTFPYTFQYSTYAKITNDPFSPDKKYWIDIRYPRFKATIHISYKVVDHNLIKYLEDARRMVVEHIPKANAIKDSLIIDRKRNLFGLAYDIRGNGVASPYQFFLTDSTRNFIRGSLYFYVTPNNDSLAPVIRFIKGDIRHLLNTFEWKVLPGKSVKK
jgi:gliding motility-associated lipoprotein GldD